MSSTKTQFYLTIVTVAALLFSWLPFLWVVTYPIELLATFIHEGCHALAAILTGGSVEGIRVNSDGSGLTYTRGGISWVISTAGYLGTTAVGALALIAIKRGYWKLVSCSFALICLVSLLALDFSAPFTLFVGLGLGVVLLYVATLRDLGCIFTIFCSLQVLLNSVTSLIDLIVISSSSSAHTDAFSMQQLTGIPALFWAALWMGISTYLAYTLVIKTLKF